MQKSCVCFMLQLSVETLVQKIVITSNGDSLLLATAEWAAKGKGCSYPIICTQLPWEIHFTQVPNYM